MRGDRLIKMILLLQTQGKLTTQTLANELEVSRRTILRDIDVLSSSGIPIYTDSGHGGGVGLDENYRSRLTGLNEHEAQTLFITDNSRLLSELGLSDEASSTFLKLLANLPSQHRTSVDHMRQRILIDPDWWFHESIPSIFWNDLYHAVLNNQRIKVIYETFKGEHIQRKLDPYSLVSKSSNWYLVAQRDGDYRIYRVSRFQDVVLLDERFNRQKDFDLQSYWRTHSQAFAKNIDEYKFILKVKAERMVFIKTLLPGRTQELEENEDWVTLEIHVMSIQFARMVIFELGSDAIIIEPEELRTNIINQAQRIITHFST